VQNIGRIQARHPQKYFTVTASRTASRTRDLSSIALFPCVPHPQNKSAKVRLEMFFLPPFRYSEVKYLSLQRHSLFCTDEKLTSVAECFLRSWWSLRESRNFPPATANKRLTSRLFVRPAIWFHPEPIQSNPHLHTLYFLRSLPSTPKSSTWYLAFWFSDLNYWYICQISYVWYPIHMCYPPSLAYHTWQGWVKRRP
jgi:hypothetical protein